jgi:hypothetical protein
MKKLVAALTIGLLPTLSTAEMGDSPSDCSLNGFAASGQTWAGLPVMPGAMLAQPTINGGSCGFAVEAKLKTIEEWYQRHLVADGWRLLDRKEQDRALTVFFERDDQKFKLFLSPSYGAIVVLVTRPEPNKTMEPTR